MEIPYHELDLRRALDTLTGYEVLILVARFCSKMTLEEVAERLTRNDSPGYDYLDSSPPPLSEFPSVTREMVRQYERRALWKIRAELIRNHGDVIIPVLQDRAREGAGK